MGAGWLPLGGEGGQGRKKRRTGISGGKLTGMRPVGKKKRAVLFLCFGH